MEIKTLFGLPAHPLVVHAAVVLLPLAAILTIVVAVWPKARRPYGAVAVGMALVSTIAVALASGSGEQLEEQVKETALVHAHTRSAEGVLFWALGVLAIAVLVYLAGTLGKRLGEGSARPVQIGLAILAAIVGIGATWSVIDVGHTGAKATWNEVQQHPVKDSGAGEGGEGGEG